MSKYTTQLRYIAEALCGYTASVGADKIDELIDEARTKIFNFTYPAFPDAERKEEFERNFILYFFNREIAYETYGMFNVRLRAKLNTIMPYYIEMYNSTKLEFEPLVNVDYTKRTTGNIKHTGDVTVEGESTSTGSNTREDKFSDTPQDELTDIREGKYLSAFDMVTDNGTNTDNSRSTDTRNLNDEHDLTETRKGKEGTASYASMLKEYRETLLNIDKMVFDELESLFLCIW